MTELKTKTYTQRSYDGSKDPVETLGKRLWALEKALKNSSNEQARDALADAVSAYRKTEENLVPKDQGLTMKTEKISKESEEVPSSLRKNKNSSSKAKSSNKAWTKIEKKAQEKAKSKDIPLSKAIWNVCRQNEQLYKNYKEEQEYGPYENYEDYGGYGRYEDSYGAGQSTWEKIRDKAEARLGSEDYACDDFPTCVAEVLRNDRELYTKYKAEKTKDRTGQSVRKRLTADN